MADEQPEKNVFEEMEAEGSVQDNDTVEPISNGAEIDYDKLSNSAVGDKVKYERVNLDGKTVTVLKAQLFAADTSQEPEKALNSDAKKYRTNFIVHYDTENKDREYISGVIQFVNRDGGLSEHQFWYPDSNSQVASLWEKVAEFKNKKPEDLSPREFLAFLNNKPKALIESKKFQYPGKPAVHKNVVAKFVA